MKLDDNIGYLGTLFIGVPLDELSDYFGAIEAYKIQVMGEQEIN